MSFHLCKSLIFATTHFRPVDRHHRPAPVDRSSMYLDAINEVCRCSSLDSRSPECVGQSEEAFQAIGNAMSRCRAPQRLTFTSGRETPQPLPKERQRYASSHEHWFSCGCWRPIARVDTIPNDIEIGIGIQVPRVPWCLQISAGMQVVHKSGMEYATKAGPTPWPGPCPTGDSYPLSVGGVEATAGWCRPITLHNVARRLMSQRSS